MAALQSTVVEVGFDAPVGVVYSVGSDEEEEEGEEEEEEVEVVVVVVAVGRIADPMRPPVWLE